MGRVVITIEADVVNLGLLDVNKAVSVALANSPDMEHVHIKRITMEDETDG